MRKVLIFHSHDTAKYITVEEVQGETSWEVIEREPANPFTYTSIWGLMWFYQMIGLNKQGTGSRNQEWQNKDVPNIGQCIASAFQSFFIQRLLTRGHNNWVGRRKVLKKCHSKLLNLLCSPWTDGTNTRNFMYLFNFKMGESSFEKSPQNIIKCCLVLNIKS